jgi:hypothetical protein
MNILKLSLAAVLLSACALAQSTVNLARPPITVAAPVPVWHVDTLALATLPTGATTYTFTLTAAPIAAMGAVVYYTSSVFADVAALLPSIQPSIIFTLPGGVTYTNTDIVQIGYFSTK